MTFDAATRALYIDAGDSAWPPPVILGILSPDQRFSQWIVDPDRGDAAAAGTIPALTPEEALREIASQCRTSGARLCVWTPPLAALAAAEVDTDLRDLLEARYEGVVDVALTWAATYPGLMEPHERRGSREQLQACFRLAGYRLDRPSALQPGGRPGSVDRARGRLLSQHQVTPDWQDRRDGNRHDCLGLRDLMLRATAELEKRAAYLDTVYSVRDGERVIEFSIGSRSAPLDALLGALGVREWAHVSACDPGLETLTPAENRRRSTALALIARQRGYTVLDGAGQDRERRRPPEDTRFIAGMPVGEARALARQFGQWAIVAGTMPGPATLAWCLEGGADPLIVNQLATAI